MSLFPRSNTRERGVVMVVSLLFVAIFSALAVSLTLVSNAQAQLAGNQHRVNSALLAAQSGLECAKYVVRTTPLPQTAYNTVSDAEANQTWTSLYQRLQTLGLDSRPVTTSARFTDTFGSGDQIFVSNLTFGSASSFTLRFYRYDADPRQIKVQSTGTDGAVTRNIRMEMQVTKDSDVLQYGVATRGRMWLTGDTTVHGPIYSSWSRPEVSPFNMTGDSRVDGSINTVLTRDQIESHGYQLETLNANGVPIDRDGNPLGTNYEDRYYGSSDEIQGYHEGINYGQPDQDQVPGLDISGYNTTIYKNAIPTTYAVVSGSNLSNGKISSTAVPTVTEYFPHAAGNYTVRRDSGSRQLTRYKYEDKTFSNVLLPSNKNALFKNCTFEQVLYIDCGTPTSTSSYNNVRFENCTFNGVIVTNVPQSFKWQNNTLYFTGTATFNNQSSVQEATILAPHFNVNLGNANPELDDNNILTGTIVGGIVDVRGNAQIYGTIISMADTSAWTSGYVTNIGATLNDGGSETTEIGDIGTITITPDEDNMLPSGITTPIVIKPTADSYREGV